MSESLPDPNRPSRRDLLGLATGGLLGCGFGAFGWLDLLRAEDRTRSTSRKSVVFVHLDGGPPQHETVDPKPFAPSEIRGEFGTIATAVPGLECGELLPKFARMADRFVVIRSLTESAGRHDGFQCQSGFTNKDLESFGGRPALGCVLSKLQGSPQDVVPTFVDAMQGRPFVRHSARPGFLGPAHKPFRPDLSALFERPLEPGMVRELANKGGDHATSLRLNPELSSKRLDDRTALLGQVDRFRREVDASGMMDAMDRFGEQAVAILVSGALADALDLDRVPEGERRRYLTNARVTDDWFATADRPNATLKFLLARRLLEAGVRVVSLSLSDFDTHSGNFLRMRQTLPLLDHGLTTFVADLDERGMLDDTLIVAWGEFGRTPKINGKAGRDHWPRVGPALLAGGGLRTGQVIGSTDRFAGEIKSRPVTYKDVFATIYHHLGLDPHAVTITDPTGRPQYLLDAGTPLSEV